MSQEPGPADNRDPQDVDTTHAVPEPDPANTPEQEIAIEQEFVDRVYERVDILRGEALGNRPPPVLGLLVISRAKW